MTNKQLLFGTTVVGLSLIIASVGVASAANNSNKRPNSGPKAEAREAVISGDYSAWLQALEGHPNVPFELTEETFNAFKDAHDALQAGDKDGAAEILTAAGIELPKQGPRSVPRGMIHGKGFGKHGHNEDVRNAIEANDYTAWLEAIADKPMSEIANEDIFGKMVHIHEAREAGNRDTARELHQELRELIRNLRSN